MEQGKQLVEDNMEIDSTGGNPERQPNEKVPEIPVINLEEKTGVKQAEEIIHLQKHIDLLQAQLKGRGEYPRKELERSERSHRES